MIKKTIQEIINMLQAPYCGDDIDSLIHGVCMDSRIIEKDALYIPLIGQRNDGHDFIDSVIEKGVKATLWQEDHKPYPDPKRITSILVKDTQKALQDLGHAYHKSLSCLTIAVTGSNGKTSCKDMLYSIFSQAKKTQKTLGNRNNEIGLPLTILDLDEDSEVAILEMGMENKGEIQELCEIAQPDISVITSIGSAHMENLGGKLEIAKAKLEILENLKEDGLFLYHKESPEIDAILGEMMVDPTKKIVSFGRHGDVFLTSDIRYRDHGISFTCNLMDETIELNAFGDFQALNALPCIYIAKHCGLSDASILAGLKELEMTKMRTAMIQIKDAKIIDDTYKSNPESAKAAIDTLMKIHAGTHIAILSDMLDLGPDENKLHASIGEYATQKGVDILYCIGPLSKNTVDAFGKEALFFETKEELIEALLPHLSKDTAILIKGSRAMKMDEIIDAIKEI